MRKRVALHIFPRFFSSQGSLPTQAPFSSNQFEKLFQGFQKSAELDKLHKKRLNRHEILNKCERLNPHITTYDRMIVHYINQGDINTAEKLFDEMLQFNKFPNKDVYSKLIKGMVGAGRVHEAQQYFEQMSKQGLIPSLTSLAELIKAQCLLRNFEIGRSLVAYILTADEADIVIFNNLIETYGRLSQMDNAMKIFKHIRNVGMAPNLTTYNLMIRGFSLNSNANEAWKIFNELRASGLSPDNETYSNIFTGYVKAGNIKAALEVEAKAKEEGFSLSIYDYGNLILSYLRRGEADIAQQVLDELKTFGMARDFQGINLATYNYLLRGLGNAGGVEGCHYFLAHMTANDISPDIDSYNALLEAYCLSKDVQSASMLLGALAEAKFQLLPEILQRSLTSAAAGRKIKNQVPRASALTFAIYTQGLANNGFTSNAFEMVMSWLAKQKVEREGRLNEMESHKKEREKEREKDKGKKKSVPHFPGSRNPLPEDLDEIIPPRALEKVIIATTRVFNTLIQGFLIENKPNLARQALQALYDQGLQPDSKTYSILLNYYCSQPDRIPTALKLYQDARHKISFSPNYFSQLINGLERAGKYQDAEQLFEEGFLEKKNKTKKLDIVEKDDGKVYQEFFPTEELDLHSMRRFAAIAATRTFIRGFRKHILLGSKDVPKQFRIICGVGRTDKRFKASQQVSPRFSESQLSTYDGPALQQIIPQYLDHLALPYSVPQTGVYEISLHNLKDFVRKNPDHNLYFSLPDSWHQQSLPHSSTPILIEQV